MIKPFNQGGKPLIKCGLHGLVQPILACQHCAMGMQAHNNAMREALKDVPAVLKKAATDLDVATAKLRAFEDLVFDIKTVTHKDYCVDKLHGALPEGKHAEGVQHHPACAYLTECVDRIHSEEVKENV